jgi:hypothetical protein
MKRTTLFSLILLLFCNLTIIAQKNINQQIFNQLRIDKAVIGIENMVLTDALDANNKMVHTASFSFTLNDDQATRIIIDALQSGAKDKWALSFYTINSAMQVTAEKLYTGIVLLEMNLPAFDGASSGAIKVTVKISAVNVQLMPAGGTTQIDPKLKVRNPVFINYFSFGMGSLPCTRISKISSISIKPADKQLQTQTFTIEMAGVDGSTWNQWFLTGAGGNKKEQGYIQLLSQMDMKTVVFTILLNDTDIMSYSTATGAQNKQRTTIGLRVRKVSIK